MTALILSIIINICFGIYLKYIYDMLGLKFNIHSFTNLIFCVILCGIINFLSFTYPLINIPAIIITALFSWEINSIPIQDLKDLSFSEKLRMSLSVSIMWVQFYGFLIFTSLNEDDLKDYFNL